MNLVTWLFTSNLHMIFWLADMTLEIVFDAFNPDRDGHQIPT